MLSAASYLDKRPAAIWKMDDPITFVWLLTGLGVLIEICVAVVLLRNRDMSRIERLLLAVCLLISVVMLFL